MYEVATGETMKPAGISSDPNVKAWLIKDLEARIFIGLNVSSEIANKIANCQTSYSMLEKLETMYGKKSDLTVAGLQNRFFLL